MGYLARAFLMAQLSVTAWSLSGSQPPAPPSAELAEATGERKPAPESPVLLELSQELSKLQKEVATAQEKDKGDEILRKQIDLQQKQIQVLEKMVRLLAEQMKKEPSAAAVEKLKEQTAVLENRAAHAARRDVELAGTIEEVKEQRDADQRNGVLLPAPLRELFLPTRPNQSPIAIYGTLAGDYQDFQDSGDRNNYREGNFNSPVFSPHFYLLLNEHFLFEINPEFRSSGVEIQSAQIDWFINDHLTMVAGRFYSPLGFFSERLHTSWVYKTPDRPLMFSQVFPAPMNLSGVQLRGARYLGDLPVKLEYAGFVSNGLSLDVRNPTAKDFADLRQTRDPFEDVNQSKAWGGRLGLSFPEIGLIVGLSGMANGAYDRAGEHDLSLWDVDVSWHKGNWDFRFEYARANQQAPNGPIHRQGLYAQVAYRDYQNSVPFLSRWEGVFRYDYVDFDGINLAITGLDFGARERIPVDRQRFTLGVNYYFYESLVFKLAYEINDELRFRELKDNGIIAQMTWGF
jgi:hypothetical protein